jgi:hypothetical protein
MEVKTNISNCIFCNNPLDNSDEHIIPDCLNGRLRSTKLICHTCNTKKFGRELDPIVKQLFNTTLLVLGLKNANSVHSEDPEGTKYLYRKTGEVSHIKPELTEVKKDGKTYIIVDGDKKNAVKYFAKHTAELLKMGYKPLKFDVTEINGSAPPLRIESNFEITKEIILELNKIAIEFYAHSGLELSQVKHISERVNALDTELNNVIFCNREGEIRTIGQQEISHLIVLRTNKNGTLYCYIELFNIICAYIKLYDNCDKTINYIYHQDAITGEQFANNVTLNLEAEPANKNDTESFELLINAVFDRLRERNFFSITNEIYSDIKIKTEKEVKDGSIAENDFAETYINRCCEALAQLSVHDFPYMIEDFKDEENHELNYIHSNLQDTQFDKFCELNQHIIGLKVNFPDEGEYFLDSFHKRPFLKRNGITLVKVYCILTHSETKKKKYLPYRDFFEGLVPNNKTEDDSKH